MQSVALSIGWTLSGAAHEFALAFRSLAESAVPLAVTALWQGIAVASALAICLRLAPRMSAAHRFLLWFSGFVALVCLPILPVLFSRTAAGSAGIPSGLAGAPAGPRLQLDIRRSFPQRRHLGHRGHRKGCRPGNSLSSAPQVLENCDARRSRRNHGRFPCLPESIARPPTGSGLHYPATGSSQRDRLLCAAYPHTRVAPQPPHPRRTQADRAS